VLPVAQYGITECRNTKGTLFAAFFKRQSIEMKHHLAPVAALLISVSILLTGQGLQGILLPVRAGLEGFPTIAIGAMGAAYFLGFTVGCFKSGELVRRVGHVRVFLAMTALASAAPLVHGLALTPWVWWFLRLSTGFCFAVIYVVIESWLNERSTNDNRGLVFSVYSMITMSVLAVGQLMTLLYDPTGMELFAIAAVLVSIAAIPVALSTSPTPDIPHLVAVDLPRLFRISRTGALGCLVTGLTNGSFWSLAPVFTQGVSDDSSLAAWFMTSAVIGGAISQWPLGVASDTFGRRVVLITIALIGALAGVGLVFLSSTSSFVGLNILGLCWGMMAFPLYAISVAYSNDYADPSEYVMVSSGLLLMYGLGATAGPFVASAVMTFSSVTGLFLFAGTIHMSLALFAIVRAIERKGIQPEEPISFGDALTVAQTASQVYEEEIQRMGTDEDAAG